MIGIFVIARLGSLRLPKKHLLFASGKMFIEWQIERFYSAFESELLDKKAQIFIVTSDKPENKQFEQLLKKSHPYIKVFYGSDGNIPLRQNECAQEYNIDHIISIDGDDILVSTAAAKKVAQKLEQGSRLVKTFGLPLGMNIMGFSKQFLNSRMEEYKKKEKLETGWGRIFDERDFESIKMGDYENDSRLRFTLDYEQDQRFFEVIVSHFKEKLLNITDEELIEYVIDSKVYSFNEDLKEIYLQNFNALKNTE